MKIFDKIVIGFLFILLLFSVVLIANFYQNQRIDENFKMISHSEEVLQVSEVIQKNIVDIQNSDRGFFISGSDNFLNPYSKLKNQTDTAFTSLKNLVADNPAQQMRIIKMQDSFNSWETSVNNAINIYKAHFIKAGKDSALAEVSRGLLSKSPKKITSLKAMISAFENEEYRLRVERDQNLVKTRRFSNITAVSLVGSAFFIGVITLIIVSLSIKKRIKTLTDATQKIASGDYGFRIKDVTNDELSAVSSSINIMTKSLEETFTKLTQSNKDLEQYAWISSHDLKEPMRMVSIYTQLLENKYKDKLDEEADIAIGYIVDGIKKMYLLVNGLLEYARIGSDGVNFENISTSNALECAIDNLQKLIGEKNAEVKYHWLPEVKGNKLLLVQLFQNLIHNAIKFNEANRPDIEVNAVKGSEKEWLFSLKDNGIGIDPKYSSNVFVIFQRFQDPEKYDGTGIGLSYCKKIVELHGGRIWFESIPGKGTTFFFTLPAA